MNAERPQTPETPLVSVIIPHLNDLAGLNVCLARLCQQSYPHDRFEVIVADNGSDCDLATLQGLIADRARLVFASVRGAGPARNAGVAAARGGILAFTDADCEPASDWLESGVSALREDSFVGGSVTVTVRDVERPTPAEAVELAFGFQIARYAKSRGFVASCNLFVTRDDFHRVGGFLAEVSEDVEWCWRAQALGLQLTFDPNIRIAHAARSTWPALRDKYARVTDETFHLGRTRRPPGLRWTLRALAIAISPLLQGGRLLVDRRVPRMTTRMKALGLLCALRARRALRMIELLGEATKLTNSDPVR